jgi:anti-sigma factor RsiW
MACREVVEAVTAYLEGAMSARDHARFEAHLAGCEHCATYLEQIRTTIELTGRLEPDDLSPQAREALDRVFAGWSA